MRRRPPRSTRTDTLCPYTTRFRSTGNRRGGASAVNGTIPGPLLRFQEGTTVRLNVHNQLEEDTSIHWHGLLVPFQLDGVPGVRFPGVKPGETFTAEFPVRQSGTYWWHRSEERRVGKECVSTGRYRW